MIPPRDESYVFKKIINPPTLVVRTDPFRRYRAGFRRRVVCGAALGLLLTLSWSFANAAPGMIGDPSSDSLQRLIERLGSDEYAQRERASSELLERGVEAFDVLNRARRHEDVEVRKQAEYLLRSIRVEWVQEGDDPQVQELLRNYRSSPIDDRESRLKRLVRVAAGAGIEPLCRLVRFETSENLSKRAALLVMNAELPERSTDEESWDQLIEGAIQSSQRPAADWLRSYAAYLRRSDNAMDEFADLVLEEEGDVNERPDKVRLAILRDLLRWQVDSLEKLGRRNDAIEMMWRTIAIQDATNVALLETVDWLIDRSAWELIEVLADKFVVAFEADPKLLYRQAEVSLRVGDQVRADELAAKAMGISRENEPFLHVEVAQELQSRGLFDWAENEYRHVIEHSEKISPAGFDARIRLGWMLHDQARNKDAYETLQDLVKLVGEDGQAGQRVLGELDRDLKRIRGQMHFSNALDLKDQEKWKEQAAELKNAIKYDPFNADIMIAMFHVREPDKQFAAATRKTIRQTADRYRSSAIMAERKYQADRSPDSLELYALMLNQYAWLVANTEGDFQAALSSSKKSLALIPDDPGYLDTLARCYYAVGDYKMAVETQEQAVRFDPHSGQIQRQLEMMEKALSEQEADKAE
ncbi:MAG: hypothetical protein GY768_07790 [Planctomycetaceae bacterium]|nr:hypothetical protein [Planctomycetaceae bacterium]